MLCELRENLFQFTPVLQQFAKLHNQRRCITICDLHCHFLDPHVSDESKNLLNPIHRERALGECRALIEDGERVAHAAVRLHGDDGERLLLCCNARFLAHMDQPITDLHHRNPMEVIALTPRLDRRGHLVRLRCCKDKDHARGRLLKCLEQCVERLRREHVYFIDDVDLVVSRRRRELHGLAQVADLINAAIGCRVDLKHIHRRTIADGSAGVTDSTGCECRTLGAVQRTCKDLRRTRLARAARSCKEIGMARLSRRDCPCERTADMLLPHEIGEALRSPAAIERDIGHDDPSQQQKTAPQGCNDFTRFLPRQATVPRRPHGT